MLRWIMPFLVAMFAFTSAAEAVGPAGKSAARRAASQLPAGLPRAHYRFKTTIAPATPSPYGRLVQLEPEVPFTPTYGYVSYVPPLVGAVTLPGYPAWSGYEGLPFGYGDQGDWYSSPDNGSWNRLPDACGLSGYC